MRPLIASVLCLVSLSLFAQTAPLPPAPYPSPITGFTGRYLDSSSTFDRFIYLNTFRAYRVKFAPERDRVYMIMSFTTFAGQRLSTFPGRLASEALQTVPGAPPFFGEKYLALDESFDAVKPGSGWPVAGADVDRRLYDFDWDDRGLTYLAYGINGWGILDQNLQIVSTSAPSFAPRAILSFRNGSTYYALVSGLSSPSTLYDVTDPQAPFPVGSRPPFPEYAKSLDGHIAIAYGNTLRIYTAAGLVADTALATFTHTTSRQYADVTTDGANFYALELSDFSTTDTIHILQPSVATYTDVAQVQVPNGSLTVGYGAGYLAVTRPFGATRTIGLYQAGAAGLTLLNDTYLGIYNGVRKTTEDAQIILFNGQVYLVIAANGLGDVFELVAPLTAPSVSKAFSPATGPMGAPVRLVITLTNPNAAPITGVAFTDNYPANLFNATPANAASTCGGSVTAPDGGTLLALSGGTIPASSSCSVSVDVVARAGGSILNSVSGVTSTNAPTSTGAAAATFNATISNTPTLSQWSAIVLAALLALAALRHRI